MDVIVMDQRYSRGEGREGIHVATALHPSLADVMVMDWRLTEESDERRYTSAPELSAAWRMTGSAF